MSGFENFMAAIGVSPETREGADLRDCWNSAIAAAVFLCEEADADFMRRSNGKFLTAAGRDQHVSAAVGARTCAQNVARLQTTTSAEQPK